MNDLILEPYAVQQHWSMPQPLAPAAWIDLLGAYLLGLADACTAAGACVVGHIKLLAVFPDGGYLRVSVVSPSHPPTITGAVPDGLSDLSTTLNVLVYGLSRDMLESLARDSATFLADLRSAQVVETHTSDPRSVHAHHA